MGLQSMSTLKHIVEQPFVAATGMAALIHSTWALGTLFSGIQPEFDALSIHFWGWIIPAFLVAFALDVGQISTSVDIRLHGLSWSRGLTFAVFALSTYYLQWLYIAHHMPALELGAGVQFGRDVALMLRDAGMWIVPALLPLSTLLYTFSSRASAATPLAVAPPSSAAQVDTTPQQPKLPMPTTPIDDDEDTRPSPAVNPTTAPRPRRRGVGKTQDTSPQK
jgi:hypothetical protein